MNDSQVPYAYGMRNGHWEWIAYDDEQSIKEKVNYPAAMENQMIMIH